MASRHFPVHPNLDQLKHQAKDLLRAIRRGDPDSEALGCESPLDEGYRLAVPTDEMQRLVQVVAARAEDDAYVDGKYREVQDSIQQGMDALARKRALPLFA